MEAKENKMDRQESELIRFYVIGTIAISLMLLSLLFASYCLGAEYNDHAIADAIYYAEGEKASKPFGILSVECEGYNECRKICLNTIRNNRKRYSDYGYKKFDTYLEFLSSRYAPIGVKNDPRGLNKNWLKNVLYFLNK